MKNPFKKSTKKAVVSKVEKLEKNQLEKVVGGTETPKTTTTTTTSSGNLDSILNLIR